VRERTHTSAHDYRPRSLRARACLAILFSHFVVSQSSQLLQWPWRVGGLRSGFFDVDALMDYGGSGNGAAFFVDDDWIASRCTRCSFLAGACVGATRACARPARTMHIFFIFFFFASPHSCHLCEQVRPRGCAAARAPV